MVVTSPSGDEVVVYGEADSDGKLLRLTQVSTILNNGTTFQFRVGVENIVTNMKGEGTEFAFDYSDPNDPSHELFSNVGEPYRAVSNYSSSNISNSTSSDDGRRLQSTIGPPSSTTVSIAPLVCGAPSSGLTIDLKVTLALDASFRTEYFRMQHVGGGVYRSPAFSQLVDSAPAITAAKALCTGLADTIAAVCFIPPGVPTGAKFVIKEFAKLVCFPLSLLFGPAAPEVLAGCIGLYIAWAFTCDTLGLPNPFGSDPLTPIPQQPNFAQSFCNQIELPEAISATAVRLTASGPGFSTGDLFYPAPLPPQFDLPPPIVQGVPCVSQPVAQPIATPVAAPVAAPSVTTPPPTDSPTDLPTAAPTTAPTTAPTNPIFQCDELRVSDGKGFFSFTVEMGDTAGTFPVFYEMYGVPDALTISYEGKVLFDTNGLVSGSSSFSLSFSGSTSKVEVVVTAPNQGTAWNLLIGCPC